MYFASVTLALVVLIGAAYAEYKEEIKAGETTNALDDIDHIELQNDDDYIQISPRDREICLHSHNEVRYLHQNTPPVVYDYSLEGDAQRWAQYLANTGEFYHDPNRGSTGENLYKRWESGNRASASPARATFSWYEERHNYDFRTGTSTGGVIGHFTQAVWNTSLRLACGLARVYRDGWTETVVVARYAPPGNWRGQYTSHVMYYKPGARFPNRWQDLDPFV